jgi:hypothetical protein
LGLLGQITLFKHLAIRTELAASAYTRDITADTASNVNSLLSKVSFIAPRTSTMFAVAAEASLNYQFNKGNVNVKYRRVDPNYQSMGAFYMQTDVEQYTFGFSLGMFKNILHLQSDLGIEKNNLAQTAASNTNRVIGNVNLSVTPSQHFGVDISYSNYGISQQIIPQLNNPSTFIKYDSIRISQVNQSISFSPHVFISGTSVTHNISLQANLSLLNNNNDSMQSGGSFTSTMGSLMYALLFTKAKFNITNTLNYFSTVLTGSKTATEGYNLGFNKIFKKQNNANGQGTAPTGNSKAITSFNIAIYGGYFINSLNGSSTGHTISANPSIGITFFQKHSMQFMCNYSSVTNNVGNAGKRQQVMYSARYNVNF